MSTLILFHYSLLFSLAFFAVLPTASINSKIVFHPVAIEHLKTEKVADYCYGVSWTDEGIVICSTSEQVEIRQPADLKLDRTISIPNAEALFSTRQDGARFLTKGIIANKYFTYSGSLDNPTRYILHIEEAKSPSDISHLSANTDYIANIDFVNKVLKILSSVTEEHLFDIQLIGFQYPYGVHLTNDAVLVTDVRTGRLNKYALTPLPEPIWTCTELPSAGGLTTDESGFIHVTVGDKPIIHIISPSGQLFPNISLMWDSHYII